jgi:tetratricopeptide (TPR) repeat protein
MVSRRCFVKVLCVGLNTAVAMSLYNLGTLLKREGKLAEAERRHREALEMRRKTLDINHPYIAESLHSLALVLKRQDRIPESEAVEREALAVRGKPSSNSIERSHE